MSKWASRWDAEGGTENRSHRRISFCLTYNSFFRIIVPFKSGCFLILCKGDKSMVGKNRIGRVEGRSAIVTGGSRGIGRATSLALAREGVCRINLFKKSDIRVLP